MEYQQEFYKALIKPNTDTSAKVDILFKATKKVKRNISMYVSNMLLFGTIAVSRSCCWFSKYKYLKWHGYKAAIKAQNLLVETGLATLEKGHDSEKFDKGFASRLIPSAKLYGLFGAAQDGIYEIDADECCYVDFDGVEIREVEDGRKIGKEYTNRVTFSQSLERSIFINDTLSKIRVGFDDGRQVNCPSNVALTRIFTRGAGGRFYQKGGNSYQNIKKSDRVHLTINGKSTFEVDFASMHLNLLYHYANENPEWDDLYEPIMNKLTANPSSQLRGIIKTCSLILINAKSSEQYLKAMRYKHKEMVFELKEKGISLIDVLNAFKKTHPAIADYLHKDKGIQLMLDDSNIMENILLRLAARGILCLPLHDSIICQEGFENEVKRLMFEEYCDYTGKEINIQISRGPCHV